ncbi:hypothetical protein [Wenxinia marina]|uniref:hypothetical protein n=1 Tax=Wenxinia marina TaxID=390641 RepID=UPI0012E0A991|nr:hypothetical protein [Wenxinia marina]GGL80331.1 hypothetical protein GCM10011392_38670 [Wenxinia marina]
MDWLGFIMQFQTAIVGLIGFSGVIAAQLLNGYLARKRDENLLASKRRATTEAVKAELMNAAEYFRRTSGMDGPKADELAYRARSRRTVTLSMMSEMGYVNTTSLTEVLSALAAIDAIDGNLSFVASDTNETHLAFDTAGWTIARRVFEKAAVQMEAAARLLKVDL